MSAPSNERGVNAYSPNFHGLINSLYKLADDLKREKNSVPHAALAELRRGLRDDPRDRLRSVKFVVRFLGPEVPDEWERQKVRQQWEEECCYLTAALFASHPVRQDGISLGAALGRVQEKRDSTEGRFLYLLATRSERLRVPLRQAVSLLEADNVALDWRQLLLDLSGWNLPQRPVQRCWARHFYKAPDNPAVDHLDPMNGDTDED